MAIVEGTGLAEEVYYNVDLAFRHLLKPSKEVASTGTKVEDVDIPDRSMNTCIQDPLMGFTTIREDRITPIEKALMLTCIATAIGLGFSIERNGQVKVNGPWHYHHGYRTRLNDEGLPVAYIAIGTPETAVHTLVKAVIMPKIDIGKMTPESLSFSLCEVEEYRRAIPLDIPEEKEEEFWRIIRSYAATLALRRNTR